MTRIILLTSPKILDDTAQKIPEISIIRDSEFDNLPKMYYTKGMQIVTRDVRNYITPEGRNPFRQWLTQLQDKKARANIQRRIARLRGGNFGDFRRLNRDLCELRINYGPGYRVYFGMFTSRIVILLCGGRKGTQQRDIARAQNYWNELRSRGNEYGNDT